MENTVLEILDLIKDINPEIWSILIKQVYVEIVAKLFWGTCISLFCYVGYKKWQKADIGDEFENLMLSILVIVFIILALILALYLYISALMWFIHPEFYALRFIIQQIR